MFIVDKKLTKIIKLLLKTQFERKDLVHLLIEYHDF